MPDYNNIDGQGFAYKAWDNYRSLAGEQKANSYDNFVDNVSADEGKLRYLYDTFSSNGLLDNSWNYDDFRAEFLDDYNRNIVPSRQRKADARAQAREDYANTFGQAGNVFGTPRAAYSQTRLASPDGEPVSADKGGLTPSQQAEYLGKTYDLLAGADSLGKNISVTADPKKYRNPETKRETFDRVLNDSLEKDSEIARKKAYYDSVELQTREDGTLDLDAIAAEAGDRARELRGQVYELEGRITDAISDPMLSNPEAVTGALSPEEQQRLGDLRKSLAAYDLVNKYARLSKGLEQGLKGEKGKFRTGFTNTTAKDLFSMGITDAQDILEVYDIAKRASKGETLSNEEKQALILYGTNQQLMDALSKESSWFGVGQTIRGSLELVAQIGLTGGVSTGIGKGSMKVARKLVEKYGRKEVAKVGEKVAAKRVMPRLTKEGAAIYARRLGNAFVRDMGLSFVTPMTYTAIAKNLVGLYDMGEGYGEDGEYGMQVERNEKSALGAVYTGLVQSAVERWSESWGGITSDATKFWRFAKSAIGGRLIGRIARYTGMGELGWRNTRKALQSVGINEAPMETLEEIVGNLGTFALTLDTDSIKELADPDFYIQVVATSALLGGFGGAVKTAGSAIQSHREHRRREEALKASVEEFRNISFTPEQGQDAVSEKGTTLSPGNLKANLLRDRFADAIEKGQYADGNMDFSKGEAFLAFKEIGEYVAEGQKLYEEGKLSDTEWEERLNFGLTAQDMLYEGLQNYGRSEAMAENLENEIGDFRNRTDRGESVVLVKDKRDGSLKYLIENKGDISIVRDIEGGKAAQAYDMKASDYDIASVMPVKEYADAVYAYGDATAQASALARGQRDAGVQGYNALQNGQTAETPAEVPVAEGQTPIEETPVEETPVAETPVAETAVEPIEVGEEVFLNGEPAQVMSIEEDGTAMVYTENGPVSVPVESLSRELPAETAPASEEVAPETPVENPAETPQPEEPLPLQKNGEVDYDALMEQNPLRFVTEVDNVMGEGKGMELLQKNADKITADIEKLQTSLQKEVSPNKVIANTKKLGELQEKLKRVNSVLKPEETIADEVEETLGEDITPEIKETIEEIRNPQTGETPATEEVKPEPVAETTEEVTEPVEAPAEVTEPVVEKPEPVEEKPEVPAEPVAEKPEPVKETPKPKAAKPKTAKKGDIVEERKNKVDKKFTMYDYVENDKNNARLMPAATGVFLDPDGEWAVATDRHTMIASKAAYDPEYAGKIVDKSGAEVKGVEFPKWQKFYDKKTTPLNLDYETVLRNLDALEEEKKKLSIDWKEARLKKSEVRLLYPLNVGNKTYMFDAERLRNFVDAMLHFGADASDIKLVATDKAHKLQVDTDNVRGQLMGMRLGGDLKTDWKPTIYIDPITGKVTKNDSLLGYEITNPAKKKEESKLKFARALRENTAQRQRYNPIERGVYNMFVQKIERAGMPVITDLEEVKAVYNAYHNIIRKHAVWHGSGALFDLFDFSFMGSGEGVQAYGWGGYVTEVKNIARTYAESSSKRTPEGQKAYDKLVEDYMNARSEENWLYNKKATLGEQVAAEEYLLSLSQDELIAFIKRAKEIDDKYKDYEGDNFGDIPAELENEPENVLLAIRYVNGWGIKFRDAVMHGYTENLRSDLESELKDDQMVLEDTEKRHKEVSKRFNELREKFDDEVLKPNSYLYEVEIPDDNGKNYIIYGKELSAEQKNQLKDAIRQKLLSDPESGYDKSTLKELDAFLDGSFKSIMGNNVEGTVMDILGVTQKEAAEFLNSLGYVGIKYPAEFRSGGRDDKASNFVIFNEKDLKIKSSVRLFLGEDGREIYGFAKDGGIYLDPKAPAETPLHEYTHYWADMYRTLNPSGWNNLKKLMKGQKELWEKVKKEYRLEDEDDIADEVLAFYSGARGAKRLKEEAKRISADPNLTASFKFKALKALENLRKAIEKFWRNIAEYLGLEFTTAEEVADRILADLDRGVNPVTVMERAKESNRQAAKAKEVLDYFNKRGFKKGEIIRSITDHGVSTYIEGQWGLQDAKYRISDHSFGKERAAHEIQFSLEDSPEEVFHRNIGFNGKVSERSGAEKLRAENYRRLLEENKDALAGLAFTKVLNSRLPLEEFVKKNEMARNARYLQQRVNKDGSFTYEFSYPEPNEAKAEHFKPSIKFMENFEKEEPAPTKKEIVAAAKKAMPNTKAVDRYGNPRLIYHGTISKKPVTTFQEGKEIWMNSNPSIAGQYTHKRGVFNSSPFTSGRVMPVFVNLENPLIVDAKKHLFSNIDVDWSDKPVSADDIVAYAKKNGYDGVIIKDVKDNMNSDDYTIGTDYVAFDSSQVKSAGASYEKKTKDHYPWDTFDSLKEKTGNTYDDQGKAIPLDKRFDMTKSDIRYSRKMTSLRDIEYLDAIKKGDRKTIERLVREAAEDAGYSIWAQHGTPNKDFYEFKDEKIGSNTDAGWLGRGFYFFGNNSEYASQYAGKGGRVIDVYLKIENPYYATSEDINRLAEENSREASDEFRKQLEEEGYDGVYYNGDLNQEWVAFYPEQIKSADLITYDSKGNPIPLSERFNSSKSDIRFARKLDGEPEITENGINPLKNFIEEVKRVNVARAEQRLIDRAEKNKQKVIRKQLNSNQLEDFYGTGEKEAARKFGRDLFRMDYQDSDIFLRRYQEMIVRRGGKIDSSTDFYNMSNHASSIAAGHNKAFMSDYYQPMVNVMGELRDALVSEGMHFGEAQTAIDYYLIAKHAPERNREMCIRELEKELRSNFSSKIAEGRRVLADSVSNLNLRDRQKALVNYDKLIRQDIRALAETAYDNALNGTTKTATLSAYGPLLNGASDTADILAEDIFNSKEGNNRSGFTDEKAKEIVDIMEKDHKDLCDSLWEKIRAATDNIVDDLYYYGLIDSATKKKLKSGGMYSYYVPLRGWEDAENVDYTVEGPIAGFMNGGMTSPIKTAKGRTSIADNPIAQILALQQATQSKGAKNLVRVTAFKAMVANAGVVSDFVDIDTSYSILDDTGKVIAVTYEKPDQNLFDEGRVLINSNNSDYGWHRTDLQEMAHQVPLIIGGMRQRMTFKGTAGLAVAMTLRGDNMKHSDLGLIGRGTRFIARTQTSLNPKFIFGNLTRDAFEGFVTYYTQTGHRIGAKDFFTSMKEVFSYLKAELEKKDLTDPKYAGYREFLLNGGATGFMQGLNMEKIKAEMERIIRDTEHKSSLSDRIRGGKYIKMYLNVLELLGGVSENVMRYAAYRKERQSGKSATDAATMAKNLTVNFNRKGANIGWLSSLYAFINPTIQGMHLILHNLRRYPKRFLKAIGLLTASAFVSSLLSSLMGDDDKDEEGKNPYDRISDYTRYSNLIILNPFSSEGRTEYIMIPMSHGLKMFTSIGAILTDIVRGYKTPEEGFRQWASLCFGEAVGSLEIDRAFDNPNNPLEGAISGLVPTSVKPLAEIAVNKNFMGGRIYKEKDNIFFSKITPEYKMVYGDKNQVLIGASKWINKMAGGMDDLSGRLSVNEQGFIEESQEKTMLSLFNNPSVQEHLFNGYFGGITDFIFDAVNTILGTASTLRGYSETGVWDNQIEANDIPILNKFYRSNKIRMGYENYYAMQDEIKVYDKMAKEGLLPENINSGYYEALKLLNKKYKKSIDGAKKNRKAADNAGDDTAMEQYTEEMEMDMAQLGKEYQALRRLYGRDRRRDLIRGNGKGNTFEEIDNVLNNQ